MSRLTDLIAEAKSKDPQMGADLEREFRVLSSRLPFGLNFERHRPEAVELPQRPVRKGDKVRVLPERGSTTKGDARLWWVTRIRNQSKSKIAELLAAGESETRTAALDDLVVGRSAGSRFGKGDPDWPASRNRSSQRPLRNAVAQTGARVARSNPRARCCKEPLRTHAMSRAATGAQQLARADQGGAGEPVCRTWFRFPVHCSAYSSLACGRGSTMLTMSRW